MAQGRVDTGEVLDLDIEATTVHDFYDAEFGRLAGWTTRLVGDPDLAHDFATDAFVKLLRNWAAVRARHKAKRNPMKLLDQRHW